MDDLTDPIDDEDFGLELVFLMTENNKGRDAAAEARGVGYEANTKWCEEMIEWLDPEHMYQFKADVNRLGDFVADVYTCE